MKSLGIRSVVLLVVVLAFAVPAFASPPTEAEGPMWVTGTYQDPDGEWIIVGQMDGTFVGEIEHPMNPDGRATVMDFVGSVDGREGTLQMRITWLRGDPDIRGNQGVWVILSGEGELENLHGQGTFYMVDFPFGQYQGQIHFDPD